MKPKYFFRKVVFNSLIETQAETKRLWNKYRDKDCVAVVMKNKNDKIMIIVGKNNEIIVFGKGGSNGRLECNPKPSSKDFNYWMKHNLVYYEDKSKKLDELILVMDI